MLLNIIRMPLVILNMLSRLSFGVHLVDLLACLGVPLSCAPTPPPPHHLPHPQTGVGTGPVTGLRVPPSQTGLETGLVTGLGVPSPPTRLRTGLGTGPVTGLGGYLL